MQMQIEQGLIISAVVAIGAVLGLRRGTSRELILLGGIVIGSLFAPKGGPAVPKVLSAGQKAVAGLVQRTGGSMTAATAMEYNPAMDIVIFGVIFLATLVISRMFGKPVKGFSARLFGALIGALNGYLFARFAFPRLFPPPETTLVISQLSGASGFSAANTATAVVVFVIVLIGLGIRQAAPPKKKSS